MTATFGRQLLAQLRLVLLIKRRNPTRFLAELLVPVLLMFALVGIKTISDEEDNPAGIYTNRTQRVPDMTTLLSPGWYVANFLTFYEHGMSNLAYVCSRQDIQDADFAELSAVLTAGLGVLCQAPKFVVIPDNFRNGAAAIAAQEFREYWRAANPILDAQGRFDGVQDIIKDNEQLDEYIASDEYGTENRPRIGLAIVMESGAPDWSYSIRVNKTATYGGGEPKRNVPSVEADRNGPTEDLERGSTDFTNQYLMSGFLTVQQEVDAYILSETANGANTTLRVNLLAMPTLAYKSDTFWAAAGSTFAIFLVLSLLFPVAMVILEFVSLKETGQRELMFMMGLNPLAYTLAWVIFYLFFYLIVASVLTGVAMINVFTLAEPGIVFVYFLLFLTSSLAYAFFIAAIFERTTLAIIVGLLVYFVGYFLFLPVSDSDASVGVQIFLSLVPSTAFSLGTVPFSEYEGALVPLTWDNAGSSSNGGFTLASCLGMLVFDTILYFALALYLDAALPSNAGAARIKWYWPFTCGCLRGRRQGDFDQSRYAEAVTAQAGVENGLASDANANFEQVSKAMQDLRAEGRCVMLGNLSKTFNSERGPVHAVNEVNFTMYEGQILSLLGHNGAGKTTLSNLLVGKIPPSQGEAYIGGHPVSSDMAAIRGSLGVCPQHNILFPNLTVKEHFTIYADIKGVPPGEIEEKITEMIAEVGLTPKTHTLSKSLSGGMKRKLHLGIALLGDSKLVVLDEPTSGQDPYSRTFTWKTIERHREGRTIILTTHYMDEADLLGDRIAIMSEGKLRCIGTSLFLKNIFGVGYQMTIEKADDGDVAKRAEVISIVARHVPLAEVLSDVGTEIMLQLPLAASPHFQAMLAELEDGADRLGVVNVGISVTSLENVFLRVAEDAENVFERPKSSINVARLASDESLHEEIPGKASPKAFDAQASSTPSANPKSAPAPGDLVNDASQVSLALGESPHAQLEAGPAKGHEDTVSPPSDASSAVIPIKGDPAPLAQPDEATREIQAKRGSSSRVHVRAILQKRLRYAKRDRSAWCCQCCTPLVFLVLGLLAMKATFSSDPEAYTFNADTDEWNTDSSLSNPVPFNQGEGGSISADATTAWMDAVTMPRVDRSQAFADIGPTTTYCRPIELNTALSGFLSSLTGTALPSSALTGFFQGSVPAACTPDSEYNATTTAFSEELLATVSDSPGSRYGGLLFDVVPDNLFGSGSGGTSAALEAEYTVAYNFTGINAAPLMMNRANTAMLQRIDAATSITTSNLPLPNTKAENEIREGFSAFSATLCLAIAFAFVPSYYAVFIVREKEQRSWHQQLLNGIKPLAYWTANWIFDFGTYLAAMVVAWALIFAFDVSALTEEFPAVLLVFFFYGISITSFTYCCTFLFSNFKYSQFGMILINLVGGMVLVIVAFIMSFIDSTYEVNESLTYIYRLLPSFCFSYGLLNIANKQIINFLLNSEDRGGDPSNPVTYGVFSTQVAGLDIIYLIVESFAYTALLVVLQSQFRNGMCCSGGRGGHSWLSRCKRSKPSMSSKGRALGNGTSAYGDEIEDDDVEAERQRVEPVDVRADGTSLDDVVVLQHARKVYPGTALTSDKVAVKDLSFGIRKFECFGLLGINGAGKSSTMQMISGEHPPTAGHIYVNRHDIVSDTVRAQQSIGYCPQFDALFDRLTGREHLEFYGRVKGIPESMLKPLIESTLREMNLTLHADKLSMSYSGGNKRKLSVAIASLSTPAVVMLDEPSAGVDPAARRFLLEVISKLAKRTSVLLTTHSMEEAEAVSSRIAIMVDGRLRCLGTAHRLKTKYGQGFQLEVNLRVPSEEAVNDVVREEFGLDSGEVDLSQDAVVDAMDKAGARELYESGFREDGSGSSLLQQLTVGRGTVQAANLGEWLLVERAFARLEAILERHFPGTKLLERVGLRLRFNLPSQDDLKLSDMFGIIEGAREEAGIAGYSLSVTSLEHIFNTFAARQALVDGPAPE